MNEYKVLVFFRNPSVSWVEGRMVFASTRENAVEAVMYCFRGHDIVAIVFDCNDGDKN